MGRLAESRLFGRLMEKNPVTQGLSKKLIGGDNLESAMPMLTALRRQGFATSLHYLGENEKKADLVTENVREIMEAIHALADGNFDIYLSLTASQIGYVISDETGERNAFRIGERLRELASSRFELETSQGDRNFLMFDMGAYDYVEKTLMLRGRLSRQGVPTAVTIQANLHRSEEDVRALIADRATIRLVKGCYSGQEEFYLTDKTDIEQNYLRLASIMLSDDAYVEGVLPIFATQDPGLFEELIPMLQPCGWQPGSYEFEMYYGIRPKLQKKLKDEGHKVRIYMPFGREWWAYAARRVSEHPSLMKSAIGAKAKTKERDDG